MEETNGNEAFLHILRILDLSWTHEPMSPARSAKDCSPHLLAAAMHPTAAAPADPLYLGPRIFWLGGLTASQLMSTASLCD